MAARSPFGARRSPASCWAVVDRLVRVANGDDQDQPTGADAFLSTRVPPALSRLVLSESLLLQTEAPRGLVLCTDDAGHLPISVSSSSSNAKHDYRLLVCCRAAAGEGLTARELPAVPASLGGLSSPARCCTRIHPIGAEFVVAQLQSVGVGCSTSRVLRFQGDLWTAADILVPAELLCRGFYAHEVFSVRDEYLAFVDRRSAGHLVLLNTFDAASLRFIPLPESGGHAAAMDARFVGCSQGIVCCVKICIEPTIRIWRLDEEDGHNWVATLSIPVDQIRTADQRLLPHLRRTVRVGPIDPTSMDTLLFALGEAPDGVLFAVNVKPGSNYRVSDLVKIDAGDPASWSGVVTYYPLPLGGGAKSPATSTRTWTWTWARTAMSVGRKTVGMVNKVRDHLGRLPGAAEAIGLALGAPYASALVAGARTIRNTDDLVWWISNKWRASDHVDDMVIGTIDEAHGAIEIWDLLGRRRGSLTVLPAAGLTPEQRHAIRLVFRDAGAEDLLPVDDDWVIVPHAPHSF
ncbi:hypothetical protein BS78_03G321500 [Paspalum vaginatum]|nr:hypothetical protein BS78_03G321500 [Paspalum vaginatum]